MARSRPEKTLADYVGIAIGPLLIMLLVGSLCFFLAELIAREAAGSLFRWVLFWYVVAIVLISRIGIEQGRGYAAGYGLALAGVVSLVLIRFLDSYTWLALLLLAVVWWAANKLVWDCTLIDEQQDASGQGLLQAGGLQSTGDGESEASPTPSPTPPDEQPDLPAGSSKPPFWQRWFERYVDRPLVEETGPSKEPHAPGTWVVYFSLAALPLFGLGQLMIPAENAVSRRFAFTLLGVYVAAGLALLVTTSFLGLRRYLRQRKMRMPTRVTSAWLITGGGLIVTIMLICMLIPRPQAGYSLTGIVDKISTKLDKASQHAMVGGEAGEGDGKRIGKSRKEEFDRGKGGNAGPDNKKSEGGGKSKPGGKGDGKAKKGSGRKRGKGKGGKHEPHNKGGKKQKAQNGKNKQDPDGRDGKGKQHGKDDPDEDERKAGGRGGGDRSPRDRNSSRSSSSPQGSRLGSTFKWIIYGLLALAAIYCFIKYREQIMDGLRQFFADLRNLFARKPKPRSQAGEAAGEPPQKTPPRPFASFANPFETGTANRMQTETVIAYTFEAMESWAYEQQVEHKPEQTPMEFAEEVGDEVPAIAGDSMQLAKLYTKAAYSDDPPPDQCRDALRETWHAMSEQSSALARREDAMVTGKPE
ncbi:MAG: DUF4129 domain-containing protein [Planctomycetaceae bacterium]